MQVKKAVITAAGRGVRLFPAADTVQKAMLPLVDRDGLSKPVIQIIAEEALESGIQEICVVCGPGDEDAYVRQFTRLKENLLEAYRGVDWARVQAAKVDDLLKRLHFAPQKEALGYGHAVGCARDFVGAEPFLLLLGDHLYLSHTPGMRCAQQLIALASQQDCAVAAVQATREHLIGRYGTLSGKRLHDLPGAYQIEKIMEKPSLSRAELELQTPGLRTGQYLCFFGMHVLPHHIFSLLEGGVTTGEKSNGEYQLTPALQELARQEKYLALEIEGIRYDIGAQFGLLQAQLALGLASPGRDEMLMTVTDLLAEALQHRAEG
jgi:UTP--glucose-1-phosphate uridylyltransferase